MYATDLDRSLFYNDIFFYDEFYKRKKRSPQTVFSQQSSQTDDKQAWITPAEMDFIYTKRVNTFEDQNTNNPSHLVSL